MPSPMTRVAHATLRGPNARRRPPALRRLGRAAPALAACALLAACATGPRNPVPEADLDAAAPYGITIDGRPIRTWGDSTDLEEARSLQSAYLGRIAQRIAAKTEQSASGPPGAPLAMTALTLSGGGADGAFGAGLLNGWTVSGERPEFDIVTGVSTGAIIATFAFAGPDYDDELTAVYTTYETADLLSPTLFSALTGGSAAVADTAGYRALIETYVDDALMRRLAEEHAKGRTLLIGTTNLDASRPVIWNVSAIAATGHPDARRLVVDVIEASSAIPVAFPPVVIPVETPDGRRFDEMHVDGGATNQVFLFSPNLPANMIDAELGLAFDRTIYVVLNNRLRKSYEPVRRRILPIAATSASSLIGGSGSGDVYRIFAIAQRDGVALQVVGIPPEFQRQPEEPFDPDYMQALYDLGFQTGLAGEAWSPYPPGFQPPDDD
ncbi:MAG: patatin-like phospholipase family protein [Pseudomonadota bacterium]